MLSQILDITIFFKSLILVVLASIHTNILSHAFEFIDHDGKFKLFFFKISYTCNISVFLASIFSKSRLIIISFLYHPTM
ncbi:hypothetical protein HOF65_00690 [bacterium]|nr:hypothetical protein [bacterium]MBT3852562.1 hypothetical protein [bacterium]MBT4632729.1 hypothetical protein [bacterium]